MNQKRDDESTSVYARPIAGNERTLRSVVEENESTRTPFSTETLLQKMTPTARHYYRFFRLLEPPRQKQRLLSKIGNIFVCIVVGALGSPNFQYVPGEGVQPAPNFTTIGFGILFLLVMPYGTHSFYLFYEDRGENIYALIADLPLKTNKARLRELKVLDRILKVGGILLILTYSPGVVRPLFLYASVAPLWFLVVQWLWLSSMCYVVFLGGLRVFIFSLYHISLISSCATNYIESISEKYHEAFIKNCDVEDPIKGNVHKAILEQLTLEFDYAEKRLSRSYKMTQLSYFLSILMVTCLIVATAADEVINAVKGLTPNIGYFLVMETLQLYFMKVLLSMSVAPSLAYKRFIDDLHKPHMLWSIGKCYQGNQGISQYFFDGFNRHRHKLIWVLGGVEMTPDVYQRISVSLLTIILTALIYSARGSFIV